MLAPKSGLLCAQRTGSVRLEALDLTAGPRASTPLPWSLYQGKSWAVSGSREEEENDFGEQEWWPQLDLTDFLPQISYFKSFISTSKDSNMYRFITLCFLKKI